MNETNLENKIIDYLNDELPSKDKLDFENLMKTDSDVKLKFEEFESFYNTFDSLTIELPPNDIKVHFDNVLETELKKPIKGNSNDSSNYKKYLGQGFFFIILLGLGLFLGMYLNPSKNNSEPIHLAKTTDSKERGNLLNLLEQKSTSKRIQAVNMSNYLEEDDDGILDALIKTFLNDKSDHVRLACIQSLSKYTDQPKVRDAFIVALDKEDDPTLQIALINVLSEIKEQKALESFDKIIQDDQSVNFVRDEAYSGKLKLINTY